MAIHPLPNRGDGYHLVAGGHSIGHYPPEDDPADVASAALHDYETRLSVELWEDGYRIGICHPDDFAEGPDGRLRPVW